MPLKQSIEIRARSASDPRRRRRRVRRRAGAHAPALDWIRARHADGALPLLRLPERRDDIATIRRLRRAACATDASDIVFLGTGGSSLGGQTLAQLAGHAVAGVGALRERPRLHFMDNLDPDSYAALLAAAAARDQRASSRSRNPAAPARR